MGGQFCLAKVTENYVANLIKELAEWRVPFQVDDVRILIKNYLDSKDIVDKVNVLLTYSA